MIHDVDADFELLDAWAAGDRRAASTLFHNHFGGIYRFFRSKVDRGAEDLTQDTFLACLESASRFRRDCSFRTYLYAVARNVLGSELRRRSKGTESPDLSVSSLLDLGMSPTAALAEKREQRLLLEGLRRLPVDDQILLELHHFEKVTGPQLCIIFDLGEPAVRSRLRRAKARLVEIMEQIAQTPDLLESTTTNFDDWAGQIRRLLEPSAIGPTPVDD